MLKNMENIMAKDVYERNMMVLYERMKDMQRDFESKKQDLAEFNKIYDEHAEQLKVSIKAEQVKSEPLSKKAKTIVSTVLRKVSLQELHWMHHPQAALLQLRRLIQTSTRFRAATIPRNFWMS
jgi:recombination DNA repair RAD52 pathway protein